MRACVLKLIGLGAVMVLVAMTAGNSGQVGLAQGQAFPVRTLGFGAVNSVVFSPDGQYVAVGTWPPGPVTLTGRSSCGTWAT